MDQAAVEQQLQFLQQVIDLNPNLIFVKDREGRFVLVNQALLDFYGTTAEEILGKTVEDLTDPEQAAQLRREDQEVLDSRQEQVLPDRPVVDAQGNQRWLQTVKRPLLDADGVARYILGVATDVTERRLAEEKIIQERNLLRTLIDTIPDYIHIKDAEGRFLMANNAVARLMGAESAEDLIGKTDFDFYPPEVAAEYRADEQAIIESGQPLINKDEPHRDSEGNWTWTLTTKIPVQDEEGRVIALVGVSRDVTERRRLHQRLQESLARRTQEVLTATEIAQEIAAVPVLDELYRRVVDLVKKRFGYYHVQIFQHDAKRNVMALVEGYGEVGARMKAAGHHLPYGRGVVGTAAASGEPVLAADVAHDPNWVPHPDLPETKGELAVPIKLRGKVLGVLDVQSDQANALSEEDQVMLLGLAGQIAGAIESTRALEQANIFRQFVQASAQGFGMATLDAQIVYVNPALARLLGEARPEDAIGKSFALYYPPEIQQQLQTEVLPTIMETGQWSGELAIVSIQGKVTPTHESFFLIRDEQGNPLYLADVLTDITEQKQAEAQLNTRIRILDCLSDIGRMIDESPPLEEFWPRLAERMAQGFQHPDLCRVAIEFEGQVYGAAEAVESPYQMVSTLQIGGERVGKIRVAYTEDRPFLNEESALLGDITRRVNVFVENRRLFQQTQQALAEMERSQAELQQVTALQRAILNAADYAIIATTPEGTIIVFNPAAERMLGYRAEEVVGRATPAIIHDPEEVAERAKLFSEELG
ncbi:MAG TPA: PAS domain S-box protein, partial [Anaerolineae bacterium]|nr:PAS domain S-box protein [Anaerolineae bacterium]